MAADYKFCDLEDGTWHNPVVGVTVMFTFAQVGIGLCSAWVVFRRIGFTSFAVRHAVYVLVFVAIWATQVRRR